MARVGVEWHCLSGKTHPPLFFVGPRLAPHLHPGPGCPWRDVVNGFVAAHLARFPAVGRSAALYHDPIRYFCVALHILPRELCPHTQRVHTDTHARARMRIIPGAIQKGELILFAIWYFVAEPKGWEGARL